MIPQIVPIEGKFPESAIITQASATLNDMGDMSISIQVKMTDVRPEDFAYDWEVEFKGERYIHAIREPQASKGNESICSVIDLTFQHWTVYQLRRFYFVKTAEIGSGTVSADKYIATLGVNLKDFYTEFNKVLSYYREIGYFEEDITLDLKDPDSYDKTAQYIEISYTHIWDVLQKVCEVFGVRWYIEGTTIKVGYPTEEVSHTFEYGFEGGLLKVERQVQSTDIRNSLLGRGGEKNLPYLYFKDLDKYGETGENGTWAPDPDAIPELRNIYFTELRGKTFRDYVQGWKTNPNRDLSYGDVVEEYDQARGESEEGWAYKRGHEDENFNPIEFVEDKESIDKYGILQGGLENQEDIYPSIQGAEVDGIGRVDEVVGAEKVVVDESSREESLNNSRLIPISATYTKNHGYGNIEKQTYTIRTDTYKVSGGRKGVFQGWYSVKAIESIATTTETLNPPFASDLMDKTENRELSCEIVAYKLYDANTNTELTTSIISDDMEIYAKVEVSVWNFKSGYDNTYDDPWAGEVGSRMWVAERIVSVTIEGGLSDVLVHGVILDNYQDGERISQSISIANGDSYSTTLQSLQFEVPENGATNVDVPVNIITSQDAQGLYEWQRTRIEAVNVDTNEVVSSINIPQGKYYLRVTVEIRNLDSKAHSYTIELMPSYIYYPTDTDEFKPKFDIWVKNIWNTARNEGESDIAYTQRVWTPILGDREGDTAKVVFTTGWLSGHSDYEFGIIDVAYAGNEGVELDGVPAEWKLTLIKSDAELEATGKYIPSTQIQANAGDFFYFIGIDMPHQYTLWAEKKLDQSKADKLLETANIKPTWVVQTDKVRLNQLQPNESEPLLNSLKIGNTIKLADSRFISSPHELLYLQSVTYSWGADTVLLPNVEVVLSDKVTTSLNPISQLQGEVDALTRQVGSLSNIQQIVRAIGDKLYLRKDGATDEVSHSTTEFAKTISSKGYRQGAVGGRGWGLRTEQSKGIMELDKLIVREEMQVNSLVVNQVSAIGGKEILSAASITCTRVETTSEGFVCYFDQKRGSVANLFQVHDIAYSQVFNANDIEVKYYKREVIAIADNSITLSLDGYGNGAPQAGDVIAQYGNTDSENHADRQYVIIRDVIGGGYERMLCDLNSVDATGTEYYFAGRMEGSTPRWFVGNAEGDYAEWQDGKLHIKGKLEVGSDVGGATVVEGGLVTAETIALGSETIKAGITGVGDEDTSVRIWAGSSETYKEDAPFRVTQDGKLTATKAEISSQLIASGVVVNELTMKEGALRVFDDERTLMRLDSTSLSFTPTDSLIQLGQTFEAGIPILGRLQIDERDMTMLGGIAQYIDVPSKGVVDGHNTNCALYIPHGHIAGMRCHIQRIKGEYQATTIDNMILGLDTSTVTLPTDAEDGHLLNLRKVAGSYLAIQVSQNSEHTIYRGTSVVTYWKVEGNAMVSMVFDAVNKIWHAWHSNFN